MHKTHSVRILRHPNRQTATSEGSEDCGSDLGELLLRLQLLPQRGVLLLQGLHQGGLTLLLVLLQGQDGGVELTHLKRHTESLWFRRERENGAVTAAASVNHDHLLSGLQEVVSDVAHFGLKSPVFLPQQLLILLHQPGHLIPVPLLALI